jgi:uncharacterized tellurite resistance protein B-like protein
MLSALDRNERMRLMKFICSFAWADLQIHPEERTFVTQMVGRLDLDAGERERVDGWLRVPPGPESVDPTSIPAEHRRLFVESIEGVIRSDGEVAPEERENLALLKDLLV